MGTCIKRSRTGLAGTRDVHKVLPWPSTVVNLEPRENKGFGVGMLPEKVLPCRSLMEATIENHGRSMYGMGSSLLAAKINEVASLKHISVG